MPNEEPTDIIAATHVHGPHCQHCGGPTGVERSYQTNDRMIEMLILALCRQRQLHAYKKGRSKTRLYVLGPDSAALDQLEARLDELMPKLDAELLKLTAAFLREHTGIEATLPRQR